VLGRLNLLNAARLREKRRYVVVGLLVLAMILTPPDVFTQMIMAVPLILLYELCIWLLWMSERRALHENG
jgi:sec-independent protein translocase protein TatC